MPEKILGIDIGSNSLKVVQVTRGFRTSQVSGYASGKLPVDGDPTQVAAALVELISEHSLESDRYLVAIGTHSAFLRRLSFPFSAERKIAQVIEFELEPGLPLSVDEVLVDFIRTEQKPDGTQGVLAAALPKGVLNPLLTALQEVGIEPEVVDLDGSVLTLMASELKTQLPERVVILDIGHSKTNLLYHHQGFYTYLRSLMFGCNNLAEKVADVLGVSSDEGLNHLFTVGLDEQAFSSEQMGGRENIVGEVELLAKEIELSLMAAQVQDDQFLPELVLLSGGGSIIKGLAEILEGSLGLQVLRLSDLETLGSFGHLGGQSSDVPVFAVAAGLCLRGARRRGFNFQAEEFRSQSPLVKWRRQLSYGLVALLLIVFSWFASVGVDIYTKKRRLDHLNQTVEEVFRRAVPDFKGSAQASQYASIVRAKINELSESVALFGVGARHHSTVELLRIISQAIPTGVDVSINQLTIDSDNVRLSGRAGAFNTVDEVKNRLVASRNFAEVKIAGAKAATDGKGVQFGLDLLRRPLVGENL